MVSDVFSELRLQTIHALDLGKFAVLSEMLVDLISLKTFHAPELLFRTVVNFHDAFDLFMNFNFVIIQNGLAAVFCMFTSQFKI